MHIFYDSLYLPQALGKDQLAESIYACVKIEIHSISGRQIPSVKLVYYQ